MDRKIIVREKKETDNDQIENILNKNFGENRFQRTVYLYRKKSPIRGLSLVSCLNKDPNTVIGTITFYRTLVSNINCLLLGPLASRDIFQEKGFGKYYGAITKTGGAILLVTGILITTNYIQVISYYILTNFPILAKLG